MVIDLRIDEKNGAEALNLPPSGVRWSASDGMAMLKTWSKVAAP